MNDEIDLGIAYIKPTNDNRVKVTINNFRGQTYIHIREYGLDGDTYRLFPTKNGYAILSEELDSIISKLNIASSMITKYYRTNNQLEFNFEE